MGGATPSLASPLSWHTVRMTPQASGQSRLCALAWMERSRTITRCHLTYLEANTGLEQLVSQSIQGQSEGVNIFLVDEILTGDPDYPSIPGVSASVPNPPYLPGTTASGVAIALRGPLSVSPANRFLDPPAVGQTIAHELGHALGLFHTSEYDLVTHDIYEDTPENDSAWLMHADGTGDQISPTQRQAIFANPIVQHVDR